ncbi:hypothetical protein QJ48_32100 [Paenibacillus sp. A3]|uniref:DUF5316 domain-containing protein n=1 Tax=Paenibacillus sp. A3 TaxID=1337054 RepID=UPI0006D58D9A|nr:DUF5316 domain-containing protein [Paenibacillus sp. A3]KPV55615.1 hypothetical protein QJ48_32100 [Paenibacillus sp. A3]
MRNSFILGLSCLLVVALIAIFLQDPVIVYTYAGIFGLIFTGAAAILTGSNVSGDRARANYWISTAKDRAARGKWATYCFMIGLPNLLLAAVVYFSSL